MHFTKYLLYRDNKNNEYIKAAINNNSSFNECIADLKSQK